jgi:hypothetical protein
MTLMNYQRKGLNPEVAINFDDCIIENICLRFPHILEQINELLDNKSLIKCKEVSRILCSTIKKQEFGKFLTKRVIQSYIQNSKEFAKEWTIVLKKLSLEKLCEFEILVKDFYKAVPSRLDGKWCPMHIAADCGNMEFCKFIAKVTILKVYELSPLVFSAQAGHLDVSKFLYKEIEDKHPRRNFEIVQHIAARNGHLDIYKLLHENWNNINPSYQEQITPLHLAAQYGHFDVCKYICDNTVFVSPLRSDRNTPLTLAVHRGHIKIARLLHERDNPNDRIVLTINYLLCISILILIIFKLYSIVGRNEYLFGIFMLIMISCIVTPFTMYIIFKILIDIWFCLWNTPKFDF